MDPRSWWWSWWSLLLLEVCLQEFTLEEVSLLVCVLLVESILLHLYHLYMSTLRAASVFENLGLQGIGFAMWHQHMMVFFTPYKVLSIVDGTRIKPTQPLIGPNSVEELDFDHTCNILP